MNTDFGQRREFIDDEPSRSNIWQIVKQVYNEFSVESTVHGLKYTTRAKTTIGRCLWLLIVSVSIAASCQLAHKFYESHETANMRTLVISNQYPSWKIELPAVTMCHANLASESRVATITQRRNFTMPFGMTIEDFYTSLKFISVVVFPTNRFEQHLLILERVLSVNQVSLEELFDLISPRCEDFLATCMFEGVEKNCSEFVSKSFTPLGICCSFNYAHVSTEHRWNTTVEDKYSINYGARFILSFLIKSMGVEDRVSGMMFGDGIKVLIHERNTYPGPTALEFVAASGHETVARLYGHHLTASREVMSLESSERDCKKSNPPNYLYRADNCYVYCREKAFLGFCGCLPFFSSNIQPGQPICNISHTSCLARVKKKAYSLTLRHPACNCLPDCENTMFSLVTTSLPFNAPQFNPSAFYKKARDLPNATAIHITFSEQSSMLQRRELVLSWINLVSSLGGVFSLFLGCSFISIIEIVYFFVIYLILKIRERFLTPRIRHETNVGRRWR